MTANAVLNPEPSPNDDVSPGASTMVRLIRESWAVVEPHTEEVAQFFYGMLFSLSPATRELFPVNMEVQRSRLLRALVHFIQMVDRPDELLPFLHQLGRDHRKFGVVADHYEAVGTALLAAIKKYAGDTWTEDVEHAWAEAYTVMASAMTEAAANDEGPAWYTGKVIHHERISWDVAVVRVQPDQPVPHQPGQYVSIEVPQRPRLWRYLTPANAPADDGILEFHVRSVPGGWVSRAIVGHSALGDQWRIGAPMGRLSVDRHSERSVLMIAGGTGLTPMRAILDELAQYGNNPQVQVFYGGRTREDLHDLENLQRLAMSNPWLTITPVLENDPDAQGAEHGTLADAVTRHGSWSEHDVLVSGSPAMIRGTVSRMLVAGTPLDRIHYDPFTLD
ncbi:globin domain-containing protein [Haloactinomyces albus]|uniref:nitric oxide dioxygenase n=1 Tax=Haloactinomyces albus TaxID=1352928 RepID=A0AAE3ZBZ1_9ACTN|nr:globin domain-containing protein [Haloactinomyces albus]MDR7302102.1 NAD(P)H-flavin reductase/hemoglobin-like flavoprotein [Haloactinomyces albus]